LVTTLVELQSDETSEGDTGPFIISSRGKKPRSVFLREEGYEPGLEKSRTVRIYL
jgi:hypothetical protein